MSRRCESWRRIRRNEPTPGRHPDAHHHRLARSLRLQGHLWRRSGTGGDGGHPDPPGDPLGHGSGHHAPHRRGHAREKLGYANVILLGWSGGGALSAFYQAEAEQPSLTHTPAGDPLSLVDARLVPADGIILMAAHVSRHGTLTEWLDASILDEADPEKRDPDLDLYGERVKPPYSETFLARYRAAQEARNRRITAWVKARLEHLRRTGRPDEEFGFVVHGTMADPRWLDPAVDPNDRTPGVCYLGDPRIVNMSPIGLARFSTLRSWLSQWSLDDARADAPACLARVKAPVLVINNSADDACTPSHARRLFDAVAHEDRRFHEIAGATHYYQDQPELGAQAVGLVKAWLEDHGFRI